MTERGFDDAMTLFDLMAPAPAVLASPASAWGSEVERERKRRIDVAAWAYAYEIMGVSIVDDHTFDREARLIRPEMSTGRPVLDAFFRTEFSPDTGMWVRRHPECEKLRRVCEIKLKGKGS